MGQIRPKNGEPILDWEAGAKGFARLSALLINGLPFNETTAA
jgi:hypothetical protein